ncbi:MAG: hypothetical protein MK364_02630 [Pirellulales bacterium]|nr:hypothetical protein [Pirellulales bacterium]
MNRSRKGGRSWQAGGPSRRAIKKAAQPTSSTHKRFSVINSPIERADWLTVSKNSMHIHSPANDKCGYQG